jgi:hypothetical protein
MNEVSATTHLGPGDRRSILRHASGLLGGVDRGDPALVLSMAAPLLEWAGEATSKRDLEYRMDAMGQVDSNAGARVMALRAARATPITTAERLTPEAFLDQARAYHAFITGAA